MARMTREFSLVLLGAGILTAGYFFWPEDDLEAKANQQATQQVAGHGSVYRGGHLIYLHTGGLGVRSSPASPSVSRGGFGSVGRSFTGVS